MSQKERKYVQQYTCRATGLYSKLKKDNFVFESRLKSLCTLIPNVFVFQMELNFQYCRLVILWQNPTKPEHNYILSTINTFYTIKTFHFKGFHKKWNELNCR